jgi:hypothetical protein
MKKQESPDFSRGECQPCLVECEVERICGVSRVQDGWTEQVLNMMDALNPFHSDQRQLRWSGRENKGERKEIE